MHQFQMTRIQITQSTCKRTFTYVRPILRVITNRTARRSWLLIIKVDTYFFYFFFFATNSFIRPGEYSFLIP